jgi:hypothetical protein
MLEKEKLDLAVVCLPYARNVLAIFEILIPSLQTLLDATS